MLKTSFSPWPSFSKDEANAIKKTLLSNKVNYWTGDEGKLFEKEFSLYVGTKYAIALSNGSVALELALKALNIQVGDEVIVTPRSFLASVSCIINVGAKPIFADIDSQTQNINPTSISKVLTKKTKAIICVHLSGWPCEMDEIMSIARKNSIYVIEDCAQAHGAIYKGVSVGSIGDIGCWSFCQDKIITTGGEGGMVTTNNTSLWKKMWSYKDHGKSWEKINEKKHVRRFQWLHDSFGTNFRMTELQAKIGRIQLQKLEKWNNKRIKNAQKIWNVANKCKTLYAPSLYCKSCPKNCKETKICRHAAYKCYVFVKGNESLRDHYLDQINENGVPCYSGSCPEIYLEKAFDNSDYRPNKRLPVAKKIGETSLMFLCHPTLTNEEIEYTCKIIKKICK